MGFGFSKNKTSKTDKPGGDDPPPPGAGGAGGSASAAARAHAVTAPPVWERVLVEAEWRELLADPSFMSRLTEGLQVMQAARTLVITNWPREAHEALLPVLPRHLAELLDLSVFRACVVLPRLDGTEGWRRGSGYIVEGPAGLHATRLTPYGDPEPLGPYADISVITLAAATTAQAQDLATYNASCACRHPRRQE